MLSYVAFPVHQNSRANFVRLVWSDMVNMIEAEGRPQGAVR
jgi:hypothetical protein